MRMPKLRTIAFVFEIIRNNYFLTRTDKALYRRFRQKTSLHGTKRDAPIVLVQCSQDYFYFGLFAEIVAAMRKTGPVEVHQYTLRSLRGGSSLSFRIFLWNMLSINFFSDWKWQRLYSAFANRVAYRVAAWLPPWIEIRLWWKAWQLWRKFKTVDELVTLNVRGIMIGDLIIDSYIRFKPSPALAISDTYLLVIIREALKTLEHSFRYFSSVCPALFLTSYTSYIQHGIPSRVAARLGIRTLAFSTFQEMSTEITSDSGWHTKDGASYKRDFLSLPEQDSKINAAGQILDARLTGVVDAGTSYMKTSAYGKESSDVLDVCGMPVIFLHDFFDSVHIYRWITFHDFWTWVCFTIDTLQSAGIPFAVKPHPNQVVDSSSALNLLVDKYPGLNLISPDTSNKQLVQSRMACAITVYGTVASEMAFMGVPTISCGDNPHVSFSFCHTARSPEGYAALLRNYRSLPAVIGELRAESCAFYYMHALNYNERDSILCDKTAALRRKLMFADSTPSFREIENALDQFGSGPEFDAFARELRSSLTAEKRRGNDCSDPNGALT
jgi:hypothetical protein